MPTPNYAYDADSTVRYNLTDLVPTLHWISSLPGAGKTRWAINIMSQRIQKNKGLTIYAAPTHKLLKEVKAKILKRVGLSAEPRLRIIDEEFRTSLGLEKSQGLGNVTETARERYRPTHELVRASIAGGLVTMNGTKVPSLVPGSIILVTHDTFLRLPSGYIKGVSKFPDRDKINVIFDEAQKCVLQSERITLPMDLARTLDPYLSLFALADTTSFRSMDFKPGPIDTAIHTYLKSQEVTLKLRRTLRSLGPIISHGYGSNVRVLAKAKVVTKSESMDLLFQTVVDPCRAFYGWNWVTIMAARLENSQMFHMLSRASVDKNIHETNKDWRKRVALLDESFKLVQKEVPSITRREHAVKAVWSKTHLTYACGGQSELSKTSLESGLVVEIQDGFSLDLWNAEFQALLKSLDAKFTLRSSLASYRSYLRNSKAFAQHTTLSPVDKKIFDFLSTLPNPSPLTPIQHLVRRSIFLSDAWNYALDGESNAPPIPITINIGRVRNDVGQFRAELDRLRIPEGPHGTWMQVPFKSQGLNTFRKYHVTAFLASINPTPEVKGLMSSLCPAYDSKLDHVVDQAVQSLARGSIRVPKVRAHRLLILPDKATARLVHKSGFLGLPKFIDPWEIADLGSGLTKENKKELRNLHSIVTIQARRVQEYNPANRKKKLDKTLAREKFLRETIPQYQHYVSTQRKLKRPRSEESIAQLTEQLRILTNLLEDEIHTQKANFNHRWAVNHSDFILDPTM